MLQLSVVAVPYVLVIPKISLICDLLVQPKITSFSIYGLISVGPPPYYLGA